jgi:hypothetical protein
VLVSRLYHAAMSVLFFASSFFFSFILVDLPSLIQGTPYHLLLACPIAQHQAQASRFGS